MERKSDIALADWKGSLTTFKGFTDVYPVKEIDTQSWDDIVNLIHPEKLAYITDKKQGEYFVPCLLKEAPFVGNTLKYAGANNLATTGKMRSKSHVTEAAMLVMDVDGLPEAEFKTGLDRIKADGITYAAFTTYSFGNPAKPGMRARLVIPLDRLVDSETYSAVWRGVDAHYWSGQAGKADPSGAKLYQQQGTWCCEPSRKGQELKWDHRDGIACVDALVAIGNTEKPTGTINNNKITINSNNTNVAEANKIADACRQIALFRDYKGADQSEPLWFDCLGVVGHCKNGEATCQSWSSGHEGYDEDKTAIKLANRLKLPQTTCDQFRNTNPEGCCGCTHKCKSPIMLGDTENELSFLVQKPHPDAIEPAYCYLIYRLVFGVL